jgi:hypothetical protein
MILAGMNTGMDAKVLLATSLVYGVIGIIVMLWSWPTAQDGQRFLRRWGAPSATGEQGAQAARSLRNRHLLYPLLFLAPLATHTLGITTSPARFVVPAAMVLLLSEIFGAVQRTDDLQVRRALRKRSTWGAAGVAVIGLAAVMIQ